MGVIWQRLTEPDVTTFDQSDWVEPAKFSQDLKDAVVSYISRRGEACLSRLAVELDLRPRDAHAILKALQAEGRIELRPDVSGCISGRANPDAETSRWGLPTIGWLRRILGVG